MSKPLEQMGNVSVSVSDTQDPNYKLGHVSVSYQAPGALKGQSSSSININVVFPGTSGEPLSALKKRAYDEAQALARAFLGGPPPAF
jgi:hypothetical protein